MVHGLLWHSPFRVRAGGSWKIMVRQWILLTVLAYISTLYLGGSWGMPPRKFWYFPSVRLILVHFSQKFLIVDSSKMGSWSSLPGPESKAFTKEIQPVNWTLYMLSILDLLQWQSSSDSVGKSIWLAFRRPRFKFQLDLNAFFRYQNIFHI